MQKSKDLFSILLVSSVCVISIPLVVLFARRPLQADTPEALIEAGFEQQNRSEVVALAHRNIGWEALKDTMLETDAHPADVEQIIKVTQAKMSTPTALSTAPLWPVLAKRGRVGQQAVWLIEAAAPCQPPGLCFTGVSPQQQKKILKRIPEMCSHRVLVIQAEAPYAVLAQQDTEQ
jgi:hypothetical protein